MDTVPLTTEVSQDEARELLMAISDLNPDNGISASELLPHHPNYVNGVGLKISDGAEDYRSKLISISYMQSPDGKNTTPVSPENPSGY